MNAFDILIAVLIVFFLIRGLFRGFIKEFFSIIGVFVGFFFSTRYYTSLAGFIPGEIIKAEYLPIIAFLILFFGVYFIISVFGVIIKYLLKITIVGWVDRAFGILSGAAKGVLIAAVLVLALVAFLPSGSSFIQRSRLAPHLLPAAQKMAIVVPNQMRLQFNEKMKAVQKGLAVKTQ